MIWAPTPVEVAARAANAARLKMQQAEADYWAELETPTTMDNLSKAQMARDAARLECDARYYAFVSAVNKEAKQAGNG